MDKTKLAWRQYKILSSQMLIMEKQELEMKGWQWKMWFWEEEKDIYILLDFQLMWWENFFYLLKN